MSEILTAIYQDGAFVPEQATHFAPGARVRLVVDSIGEKNSSTVDQLDQLDEILDSVVIKSGGTRMTRDQLHERD